MFKISYKKFLYVQSIRYEVPLCSKYPINSFFIISLLELSHKNSQKLKKFQKQFSSKNTQHQNNGPVVLVKGHGIRIFKSTSISRDVHNSQRYPLYICLLAPKICLFFSLKGGKFQVQFSGKINLRIYASVIMNINRIQHISKLGSLPILLLRYSEGYHREFDMPV